MIKIIKLNYIENYSLVTTHSMRNLILFFTFSLFLNPTLIYAQSSNNDTIISNSQDSLLIKDEIKDVELSFNIINYEINGEQKILIENLFNPTPTISSVTVKNTLFPLTSIAVITLFTLLVVNDTLLKSN